MRIDVWSDLVCPWCYIGKRRLERALAELPHAPQVDIVHRSFQLNPSAPIGTTSSRRDYLRAKYGWSAGQAAKIDADMEQRAAADGLEYHLTADGLTGNTFDAHRLVHLAGARGRQDEAVERLFRAYFTDQQSLFDKVSLERLAVDAGLEAAEARRVLAGDDYADAVNDDMREARALGVSGVPFFVFDRRLGCQAPNRSTSSSTPSNRQPHRYPRSRARSTLTSRRVKRSDPEESLPPRPGPPLRS